MIRYNTDSFGFALLFRLHGSAVFRSLTPALISSAIYFILLYTTDLETDQGQIYRHPYPMGALVAALTFLLAFRANFSYNRYWEAFTAVHQMHSKWMDVGMDIAAFHLQSNQYDKTRPPAFGEYPELTCLERDRERLNELTLGELEDKIDTIIEKRQELENPNGPKQSLRTRVRSVLGLSVASSPLQSTETTALAAAGSTHSSSAKQQHKHTSSGHGSLSTAIKSINKTAAATTPSSRGHVNHGINTFLGGMLGKSHDSEHSKAHTARNVDVDAVDLSQPVQIKTTTKHHKKAWEEHQPPLLLQEGAHLLSLLSAVAMSTLRNDLEEADSPLIAFTPGAPWPHVDPDAYGADVRKDWAQSSHRSWTVLSFLFGFSRTPAARTLYNAARPFRVIGGVSDAEIEVLQAARGPYAKVALCTMWVEEFVSREHLNQGLGAIGAPIVSRLYQFISDGMLGYNQARKIAYIPFPFPHAQITSLFVLVGAGLMPVLMLSYMDNEWYGFVGNLLTVMCFTGLHEVARELENPFQNVPNDIPLNNFQAQFNEGLMQMFAGYHPDAYWEIHKTIEGEQDKDGKSSYPPSQERLENLKSCTDNLSSELLRDEEELKEVKEGS